MINKHIDISFITVGSVWIMGGIYLIAYTLLSFASVIFEGAPQIIKFIFVQGLSFAIAIFGLWKLSEIQGNRLEYDHNLNLKIQITGTCIGAVLDPILLLILQIIPTIGTLAFRIHSYGLFPGELFQIYGKADSNEAIIIGVLINIPIIAVVRCLGVLNGKKKMIKHREYIKELAEQNSHVKSNSSMGRSWKDSVGNSVANRSEFLKNRKKDD